MPSLTLNADEVLPVGIHDCTLEEFERTFGSFSKCDRRPVLFTKFKDFFGQVRSAGWACEVVADGSFVMSRVDDPDDIDVIIAVPPEVFGQYERGELRPFQHNVLDPLFCRREYKIDLKPCSFDGKYLYWLDFFQRVSAKRADKHLLPLGSRKGLVRIAL